MRMQGHLRQSTGGAGASRGCVSAPPPSLYITGNLEAHLDPGPAFSARMHRRPSPSAQTANRRPGPASAQAEGLRAFGNASNHRSTSARRQPTSRDPWPPSLTGAGKLPARTRRHNEVRDKPISARTADVLKIAGEESRTDLGALSERVCSSTGSPNGTGDVGIRMGF